MNPNSLTRTLARTLHVFLIAGLAFGLAPAAHATLTLTPNSNFTVDTRGDAVDAVPGDGLCATVEGRCTLRAAIQETNALPGADTITLPAGSYLLSIPGGLEDAAATGDLDITDDLTITGAGRDMTGINGRGSVTGDRVFHIPGAATVTISGVTIGHGRADDANGGGIYNSGALTLGGSRLLGNIATGSYPDGFGGGIYNTGALTVTRSTLSDNSGYRGGGIHSSGTLTVDGGFLSRNSASDGGGGIYNAGTLAINHGLLAGNSAYTGGGIYNIFGMVSVSHSTLSSNTARDGGGIDNVGGTVTVTQSTLLANSAGSAGGINNLGTLTITHSTLSGNFADQYGGGIDHYGGTATITHSTLSGNTARTGGGGGIFSFATLTVSHSTLSDNMTDYQGGGIFNYPEGKLTVTYTTVSGNSARNGGGIYNSGDMATLQGAILAGNTASSSGPDCAGSKAVDSAGYNLFGNNSGCTFNESTGDLVGTPDNPIDPLLGPLQDNGGPTFTHALLESSPAIDAGNPDECPPTDQRGFPRPIDGDGNGSAVCDIGAFEYGSAPP